MSNVIHRFPCLRSRPGVVVCFPPADISGSSSYDEYRRFEPTVEFDTRLLRPVVDEGDEGREERLAYAIGRVVGEALPSSFLLGLAIST